MKKDAKRRGKGAQKSKNAASLSLRLSSSSISFACNNILPRLCIVGLRGCLRGRGTAPPLYAEGGNADGGGDVGDVLDDLGEVGEVGMEAVSSTSADLGRKLSLDVTLRRRLVRLATGRAVFVKSGVDAPVRLNSPRRVRALGLGSGEGSSSSTGLSTITAATVEVAGFTGRVPRRSELASSTCGVCGASDVVVEDVVRVGESAGIGISAADCTASILSIGVRGLVGAGGEEGRCGGEDEEGAGGRGGSGASVLNVRCGAGCRGEGLGAAASVPGAEAGPPDIGAPAFLGGRSGPAAGSPNADGALSRSSSLPSTALLITNSSSSSSSSERLLEERNTPTSLTTFRAAHASLIALAALSSLLPLALGSSTSTLNLASCAASCALSGSVSPRGRRGTRPLARNAASRCSGEVNVVGCAGALGRGTEGSVSATFRLAALFVGAEEEGAEGAAGCGVRSLVVMRLKRPALAGCGGGGSVVVAVGMVVEVVPGDRRLDGFCVARRRGACSSCATGTPRLGLEGRRWASAE